MRKTTRNISLATDLDEDIEKKKKEFNFNFSEWVDKVYRKEFMNSARKLEQIENYTQRIVKLKEELKGIKIKEKTYRETLSRVETRFMYTVPRLIREGKIWKNICNRFNFTFHRDFSVTEFKAMVRYVNSKNPDNPKFAKGKRK